MIKKSIIYPATILSVLLFSNCKNETQNNNASTQTPDRLAQNIDSTQNPADDFFLFANNGWFKNNPIPASEQSNGLWQLIQDTINAQVKNICEENAANANHTKGSAKQKVGDFFFTGMDSATINKNGLHDLKPEFDKIDAITDLNGVIQNAAYIHSAAGSPLFGIYVGQDDKISSKNAIFISQGGLSLPDRNYYFDTDSRAIDIRQKYVKHVQNMFMLMGNEEAASRKIASSIIKLETEIAKACRKKEDTRDPDKNYNKMSFDALQKSTPNVNWQIFTQSVNLTNPDTVIVGQPEFLSALNKNLKATSISDWKNYLKWHLVRSLAPYLDDKTYEEYFNFYLGTLRGLQEPKPRWKRVVASTNASLGELIGQVYVDEYLPKGTKEKLTEIGNAIKEVYADRIKNLDWMSDATKQKALAKLNTVVMKVGYPDKWKDMSALQIDRTSYVRNVINANIWETNDDMSKFGKPVDKTEWHMYPQTYNAYYNPSNNEIVVPGCNIIVPGYERVMADDAILYSIIGGSTFGHEITHGFDDQGSKYDENGNLNDWWTAEDRQKFEAKTQLIVEQFNSYVAVDSLTVNGRLTLGENIADLGGIVMGYEAFKKTQQYKKGEKIAGLTPDQRFFLGYANAWMINTRPEALSDQVRSDEHSPAKFRVLGPLSNMPEFYKTFNVKADNKMFRSDSLRVVIW
ncbi:MAG TPA: M13 family metallopeptidase [Bacteroidia bacterium]|nr:M13 family metallopeptidase [Bacteroidia bacterium]HNU32675.1 M13 family metallopeptidase [Bacteroidia bacterium]